MFRKRSAHVPISLRFQPQWLKTKAHPWALIVVLVLLLATTALAAAQSPDVLLPLITGEGQAEQLAPDTPLPTDPDPTAPIGDSRDTNSGDYDVPADIAAVDAFNTTQWTVQNNLGIGTDAPTSDLDLSRNVNNYTRIWVRNPNTGGNAQTLLALTTANSSSVALQQFGSGFSASWNGKSLKNMARLRTSPSIQGLILTTGGSYPLIMGTADRERLRITPTGQVGIGTTTPHHQLSIVADDGVSWTTDYWSGAVELTNASAIGWRTNTAGYSFGMGHTDSGFRIFRTLSAPGTASNPPIYDLTIDDSGNVGIGTTNPVGKLDVNGSARIEHGSLEVSNGNIYVEAGNIYVYGTQMNVPDYVFESEYPLLSLDELRAYVAAEKHLPNVPDAEQIAQGGVNVTDFQMTLLEKTEELTLYTLAQDEQIESQQQEIDTLQQTNQSQGEQLETLQQENQAMQQLIAGLETRLATLEE